MRFSELIAHVGDDNIQLQNIQDSLVKAEVKKNDGEITFATDRSKVMELATKEKTEYVGLIVWIPRERLP